jgi:flavodoxin
MLTLSLWPWWKWAAAVVALATFAAFAVLIVVTRVEQHQAKTSAEILASRTPQAGLASRIAVVYFSRSGNTAVAAAYIARRMDAGLFRLEAPAYDVGLTGILHALHDARSHEAAIAPTTLDLRGFDTVYLGSPIWLYSPSPPIWEFARNNRFDGKDVVLFNTFNSKFEQRFIDEFRQVVLAQGARSFRHIFVKRGRMGQQLTTGEMLDQIDAEWSLVDVAEQTASQNQ